MTSTDYTLPLPFQHRMFSEIFLEEQHHYTSPSGTMQRVIIGRVASSQLLRPFLVSFLSSSLNTVKRFVKSHNSANLSLHTRSKKEQCLDWMKPARLTNLLNLKPHRLHVSSWSLNVFLYIHDIVTIIYFRSSLAIDRLVKCILRSTRVTSYKRIFIGIVDISYVSITWF